MSDGLPLYPVSRVHLEAMTDSVGIFQHAVLTTPDPAHGYCTDDVARALQVDLLHGQVLGWASVSASARRHLRFLSAAHDEATGRFRNFRAIDGSWADAPGSEDCQGRAMHALGDAIANAPDPAFAAEAAALFEAALPAMEGIRAVRAISSIALGCEAAFHGGSAVVVAPAYRRLSDRLRTAFAQERVDAAWPWPEPVVTYENGLPARALIVAGQHHADPAMLEAGLRSLDWLVTAQTSPGGHLSPVGNGWWPRGGTPARFDQQPIEPVSLLLAAEAAWTATGEERYMTVIEKAYAWFLGENDGAVRIADPDRGSSFDGLTPAGPNLNQGAESTLMWLTALEHVRAARASHAAKGGGAVAGNTSPPVPVAVALAGSRA